MEQIKFTKIRTRFIEVILAGLQKAGVPLIPVDPKGFTFLEGFLNQPIQSELSRNVILGDSTILVVTKKLPCKSLQGGK